MRIVYREQKWFHDNTHYKLEEGLLRTIKTRLKQDGSGEAAVKAAATTAAVAVMMPKKRCKTAKAIVSAGEVSERSGIGQRQRRRQQACYCRCPQS